MIWVRLELLFCFSNLLFFSWCASFLLFLKPYFFITIYCLSMFENILKFSVSEFSVFTAYSELIDLELVTKMRIEYVDYLKAGELQDPRCCWGRLKQTTFSLAVCAPRTWVSRVKEQGVSFQRRIMRKVNDFCVFKFHNTILNSLSKSALKGEGMML